MGRLVAMFRWLGLPLVAFVALPWSMGGASHIPACPDGGETIETGAHNTNDNAILCTGSLIDSDRVDYLIYDVHNDVLTYTGENRFIALVCPIEDLDLYLEVQLQPLAHEIGPVLDPLDVDESDEAVGQCVRAGGTAEGTGLLGHWIVRIEAQGGDGTYHLHATYA